MGSLQHHRIQQRGPTAKKVLIEEVKSSKPFGSEPRFQIIRDPPKGDPQLLTVQVHVKEASSGKNLLLDVGEDRLVLRSAKRTGSLLDIFLPYSVDQDHTCAHFDLESQVAGEKKLQIIQNICNKDTVIECIGVFAIKEKGESL
ncbi:PIH1 domain-containing protein 1 [Homalodisca vitripennis]|nr:PIH1 domain-containing protein 1 [Homalodisca vitripennis]